MVLETKCPAFDRWNKWSECLWYPVANMVSKIQQHCDWDIKEVPQNIIPTPAGLQIPEKCGFCSFQMRCRKREKQDGCL